MSTRNLSVSIIFSLTVAFAGVLTSSAAPADWRHGEREAIWPAGKMPDPQPHLVGAMTDECDYRASQTNADLRAQFPMPYIEWFEKPAQPNGGCMILVSGGSYCCCCDVGLIKFWKDEFMKLGFQCVNLVYRTPRPKGLPIYQTAWEDGQRAVRLVRSQAAKRGYDPEKIGIIGMSAGGHLVCQLATSALTPAYKRIDSLDDIPCHVNWCIANAPAYNTATAAGGDARPQDGTTLTDLKPNPSFKFDAMTCPISFHHGGTDPYTPNGSTQCYRELKKRGIPTELHLYADKPHGAHGFERAVEFMRQMGYLGKPADEEHLRYRFHPDGTLRTEKEMLWPKGKMPDPQSNQDYEPYLVWYIPEKLTTKAIQIVLPGGGYSFCNFNDEGTMVAYGLNQKGMAAVVVKYRAPRPVKGPKHLSAWQDAQRAIRMVRSEAAARGLDPNRIGTMGFSAGGHLTLMTALSSGTNAYAPIDDIDTLSCSVQWACPTYPAYVLTDGADCPNTEKGLRNEDVPVADFAFDKGTPPMCLVHGDVDVYSSMASVKIWEKLRTMGVQCDLHTLATRGHCFQFEASPETGSWTWLDRLWEFLGRKGLNK